MLLQFDNFRFGITIIAACVSLLLGFFWYGPLFGKYWMSVHGFDRRSISPKKAAKIFLITFIATLVSSAFVSGVLNGLSTSFTLLEATVTGASLGIGFSVMSLVVNYSYAQRPTKLLLIESGYVALSFTSIGFIFGWIG